MATKGYHSYRGRQGIWRKLVAVLLVLILIAACAFLLLQRYITYSDDGSFYLDLPFEIDLPFLSKNDTTDDSTPPDQNVDITKEDPETPPSDPEDTEPVPDPEPEPEPEPEPPVIESYIPRRLVELGSLPADTAALSELLISAGADGFSFIVKDREGAVTFNSTVAVEKATENAAVTREQLAALCAQEGVYTVARISCLRDTHFANKYQDELHRASEVGICKADGNIWWENDAGTHWLEPEMETTRDYLIRFAVECAELGFDELLLENVCYPYRNNTYKIDYSKKTLSKTDSLALFLTELNAALEPYGVRVSLLLDEETVRGLAANRDDTGFAPEVLLPLVDAVYVETSDTAATQADMAALTGSAHTPALVPVVTSANEDNAWYLTGRY